MPPVDSGGELEVVYERRSHIPPVSWLNMQSASCNEYFIRYDLNSEVVSP